MKPNKNPNDFSMRSLSKPKVQVNNIFYDALDEKWECGNDHPIALLRAENAVRNPWIAHLLDKEGAFLDIGCGGGLLTNDLAAQGFHHVIGIDLAKGALERAALSDKTGRVTYLHSSAEALPFQENTFDAVAAMDLLEHVENPEQVIAEAARVLKPGGNFFFHTFNRNWLSYLLVIKGVEWCIDNTPENLHVYSCFIKPRELDKMLKTHGLISKEWNGLRPVIRQTAWWELLRYGRVSNAFRFRFTKTLATGYCGYAINRHDV